MAINIAKNTVFIAGDFCCKVRCQQSIAVLYTTLGKCVLYVEADFATDIMTSCGKILKCFQGTLYNEQEAAILFNESMVSLVLRRYMRGENGEENLMVCLSEYQILRRTSL